MFSGPVRTSRSGLGSAGDQGSQVTFYPTQYHSPVFLETIYGESWAAAKFVEIPVRDMWVRGMRWLSDDDKQVREIMDEMERLRIVDQISNGMISSRIHGNGYVIMMTDETGGDLSVPSEVERVGEGNLKSLIVVDRYDVSIVEWMTDPFDINYGHPELYRVTPTIIPLHGTKERGVRPSNPNNNGREMGSRRFHGPPPGSPPMSARPEPGLPFDVHASRMVEFTGRRSPRSEGWRHCYERDWALSELALAVTEIMRDEGTAGAISHLINESSHSVIKIQQWSEAALGQQAPDEPSIDEIAQAIAQSKSIYRTSFIDKNDDIERIQAQFTGVADLINIYAQRLAAIADIPITRFMGNPPTGLNATGVHDFKNYAVAVKARQERERPRLRTLFEVMGASIGIKDPVDLEYEWVPLTDMTESERYANAKVLVEALTGAQSSNNMDENEVRERLSTNEVFGSLAPMPEEELSKNQLLEIEAQQQEGGFGGEAEAGPKGSQGKSKKKKGGSGSSEDNRTAKDREDQKKKPDQAVSKATKSKQK